MIYNALVFLVFNNIFWDTLCRKNHFFFNKLLNFVIYQKNVCYFAENNKKVAFSASHISNYNRITYSAIYKWNEVNVNTNDGNYGKRAFDKTSGVFTAPYGGLYFFELTIVGKMEGAYGSRFGARLMVDGRSKAESRADFGKKDQWTQVTTQMVVSLKANQKVDARPLFSGTRIHNSEKKNSFVGFLIKPDP